MPPRFSCWNLKWSHMSISRVFTCFHLSSFTYCGCAFLFFRTVCYHYAFLSWKCPSSCCHMCIYVFLIVRYKYTLSKLDASMFALVKICTCLSNSSYYLFLFPSFIVRTSLLPTTCSSYTFLMNSCAWVPPIALICVSFYGRVARFFSSWLGPIFDTMAW